MDDCKWHVFFAASLQDFDRMRLMTMELYLLYTARREARKDHDYCNYCWECDDRTMLI